jgi:hypothetical protein
MNTFEKVTDFIGENSIGQMRSSFDELMEQVSVPRKRLGKQAYILDKYLSYLLKSANNSLAYCASSDGFDTACELRILCRDIIDGRERSKSHPFYEHAKAYIKEHPFDCQEAATKEALYVVALAHDFLEIVAKRFYEEQQRSIARVLDISDARELYQKISRLLGGENEIQNINRLFCQRFLLITPMAGYLQGLTDDLLYELTYQDRESSQMVFQLLIDSKT